MTAPQPKRQPEDPLSSDSWEAMDRGNRIAFQRAVRQLPDTAIVQVVPLRDHRVRYKGRDYEHPRRFTCTFGEAKTAYVEVVRIFEANPIVEDEPAARVRRGKGLNRLMDDVSGYDRAEG